MHMHLWRMNRNLCKIISFKFVAVFVLYQSNFIGIQRFLFRQTWSLSDFNIRHHVRFYFLCGIASHIHGKGVAFMKFSFDFMYSLLSWIFGFLKNELMKNTITSVFVKHFIPTESHQMHANFKIFMLLYEAWRIQ